jgi:hypothetical protein
MSSPYSCIAGRYSPYSHFPVEKGLDRDRIRTADPPSLNDGYGGRASRIIKKKETSGEVVREEGKEK